MDHEPRQARSGAGRARAGLGLARQEAAVPRAQLLRQRPELLLVQRVQLPQVRQAPPQQLLLAQARPRVAACAAGRHSASSRCPAPLRAPCDVVGCTGWRGRVAHPGPRPAAQSPGGRGTGTRPPLRCLRRRSARQLASVKPNTHSLPSDRARMAHQLGAPPRCSPCLTRPACTCPAGCLPCAWQWAWLFPSCPAARPATRSWRAIPPAAGLKAPMARSCAAYTWKAAGPPPPAPPASA